MKKSNIKIALVGNPNTGKTSLFNLLTGLNQKVGNYPGITIDKKTGYFNLKSGQRVELIDLPGTYSLNPNSLDEEVVLKTLSSSTDSDYPDAVIFVADATNLKRNLYFFTQIRDLNIPSVLCLNMSDLLLRKGISIDKSGLEQKLKTKVISINARNGEGVELLKEALENIDSNELEKTVNVRDISGNFLDELDEITQTGDDYLNWIQAVQNPLPTFIESSKRKKIWALIRKHNLKIDKLKIKETIKRYQFVNSLIENFVKTDRSKDNTLTGRLDKILTHKFFGYAIFFSIMFLLFQAIYSWSSIPMNLIDHMFNHLSDFVYNNLGPGPIRDLISKGIIPGLGGIVIFIPQIAILFAFISILEDTGYMSRVVFIMDRLLRPFGMSGKSVVPLMSGMACAVPAIMSTRTIQNWKERLLTILITPFITCSARLPVYSIIIALVIPDEKVFGLINLQGLSLMLMYLIGLVFALLTSYVSSKFIKVSSKSVFIIEMPSYKLPFFRNIFSEIIEKTKAFVFNAGKIIFTISIILWFLASYGPFDLQSKEEFEKTNAENNAAVEMSYASYKLENSFIGYFGRFIEPAIKPLGYDWKIGVALISSLAAREVFVGTMATIYAVESEGEGNMSILEKLREERDQVTGEKKYDLAVGWSLLLFYAFAMQCISTIAVVKKETNSWKWPIIQTVFMTSLAYISSFVIYNILK